jgi:hypothetical protein
MADGAGRRSGSGQDGIARAVTFEQLAIARASAEYSAMLERIARIDVLILDDFLLARMTDVERRDLA